MKRELIKYTTFSPEEFVDKSAKILAKLIFDLLVDNKSLNIAISGGSSPLPIYEKLSKYNLEWESLNFFLVDERCVPNDDSQSNYGNINQIFFRHIPSNNFSIVKDGLTYDEAAIQYQELIKTQINIVGGLPQFDIIILGMGLDGHTASLFPKTEALKNNKDLVVLNNIPQLGTNRITMTYPLILNAKKIVLIANGNAKKKVLDDIFNSKYPISKIIPKIYTILN